MKVKLITALVMKQKQLLKQKTNIAAPPAPQVTKPRKVGALSYHAVRSLSPTPLLQTSQTVSTAYGFGGPNISAEREVAQDGRQSTATEWHLCASPTGYNRKRNRRVKTDPQTPAIYLENKMIPKQRKITISVSVLSPFI